MRTIIFALSLAVCLSAAPLIEVPAWNTTLQGGERLSFTGGTIDVSSQSTWGLSLGQFVDATNGYTYSGFTTEYLSILIDSVVSPVRFISRWTLAGSNWEWRISFPDRSSQTGLYSHPVAVLPDGQGIFLDGVSGAATGIKGEMNLGDAAIVAYQRAPEPASWLLIGIGLSALGELALCRARTNNTNATIAPTPIATTEIIRMFILRNREFFG